MSIKLALQKVFEKKMSDAKDLLDEALNEKLALHLSEKKLDPVGQEDGDIDNDGDEDDTDSYLLNRRKKIGQAMKKEGMQYEEEKKEEEKKLDSRGLGVTRQSGLGKRVKDKKVNEGAPDTELDHHKGKNPDIFDQDYLPMKKNGKKMKAINNQSSGGY
jgi:hypothetical protein|tara:strand:- start:2194 stop:2670 length:477 start_codon:yes stop_codon:yes gene_type:complete